MCVGGLGGVHDWVKDDAERTGSRMIGWAAGEDYHGGTWMCND